MISHYEFIPKKQNLKSQKFENFNQQNKKMSDNEKKLTPSYWKIFHSKNPRNYQHHTRAN